MDRKAIEKLQADCRQHEKTKRMRRVLLISLIILVLVTIIGFGDVCFGKTNDTIAVGAYAKAHSEHIKTRQKIKDIADVQTFDELLERCMITDEEKYILRQHYYKGRSLQSIAMEINISEDWLKQKHRKILKKLQKLL